MRPANIVTAWADVLAGFAASESILLLNLGASDLASLTWLLASTTGLYGGGVVFNDVFDVELDTKERPERPIPSGRASRQGATRLGTLLLAVGIVAAAQVSWFSAVLAASIAVAALAYNAIFKHHPVLGSLNMGICRGGNLLLGVSAVPVMVGKLWLLALIPIVYIAAITTLSQGEVRGGQRQTGIIALLLVGLVIAGVLGLGVWKDYQVLVTIPFVALFAQRVLPPLIQAIREPTPEQIQTAVKAGVLSLTVLNATITAGFAGFPYGLLVLSLLLLSIALARIFAVT